MWPMSTVAVRLISVKRLSPVVLVAIAAVAALAFLRTSTESEPTEVWTPVNPS
jgi:hypothetical protein